MKRRERYDPLKHNTISFPEPQKYARPPPRTYQVFKALLYVVVIFFVLYSVFHSIWMYQERINCELSDVDYIRPNGVMCCSGNVWWKPSVWTDPDMGHDVSHEECDRVRVRKSVAWIREGVMFRFKHRLHNEVALCAQYMHARYQERIHCKAKT